jgi:hypothetical protein
VQGSEGAEILPCPTATEYKQLSVQYNKNNTNLKNDWDRFIRAHLDGQGDSQSKIQNPKWYDHLVKEG